MMNRKKTRNENDPGDLTMGRMESIFITHNLGFPRIGEKRELKRATEAYWKGDLSIEELNRVGAELRRAHWLLQKEAEIDLIPSNDFSFYDQMLDMSCLLGNVPPRFHWDGGTIGLALRFQIARGTGSAHEEGCLCGEKPATFASEMTKWFDTNYHYIVPEFQRDTAFKISSAKPFDEFAEALALGITTKPVLIGPLTYLFLGKSQEERFDRLSLLERLLPIYVEILQRLAAQGARWIQIDEPILALDLDVEWQEAFASCYQTLREAVPGTKLLLATYFGELRENATLAIALPVDALHLDLTRAHGELDAILATLPAPMILSLGIVDGRNVWRNDFERSRRVIEKARHALGISRVWLAPSCSLLHCPVSLRQESGLDPELKTWLAFAEVKLTEVATLARLGTGQGDPLALHKNQLAVQSRRVSRRIHRPEVKARSLAVTARDSQRRSGFADRQITQRVALNLPSFPTTTIGSFPQTTDVRNTRSRWKKGELSEAEYHAFLKERTEECVRFQEEAGLDVLVHGEFERNDMVEYFGEQLDGFAFTANGWVQSYGSRCVKPPIIFGDVRRPRAMTVEWSTYAQSLTRLPMKGMLTGPMTILQWSFVRDDQPRSETARQIGLAVRDEVHDLEAAGIGVIQIDEPALREGLPLRKSDWKAYLDWATEAFRLSAAGVRDETQIHTHMCYCEFNDIIDSIAALDADVISIETSRSNMELLEAFVSFRYPNEVGPGVWDIHSPRVPSTAEMTTLLRKAADVLPAGNLWVNPDCGLKTRGWEEVKAALRNMVTAASELRQEAAPTVPTN
jgi:5-methyltetrahydropteroyltriglutamate--homocysteine methyltransferase